MWNTARVVLSVAIAIASFAFPPSIVSAQAPTRTPPPEAVRQRAEAQAKAETERQQDEAQRKQEMATFRAGEDARIGRDNAAIRSEAGTIQRAETPSGRGTDQERAEAAQLRARATRATTEAELMEIHLRARQLLEQLRRR